MSLFILILLFFFFGFSFSFSVLCCFAAPLTNRQANYLSNLQQLLEGTMNPDTSVIKAVSLFLSHEVVKCSYSCSGYDAAQHPVLQERQLHSSSVPYCVVQPQPGCACLGISFYFGSTWLIPLQLRQLASVELSIYKK